MNPTRRLAAILAADVAGYSRLIGSDEAGTLGRLRTTVLAEWARISGVTFRRISHNSVSEVAIRRPAP